MLTMTSFSKYDIVVVKFPFASSRKYKARPAVIVSSELYNTHSRNTLLIMAISSQITSRLHFEPLIVEWEKSGLLKPSIIKSAIATIEKEYVLTTLGKLGKSDQEYLDKLLERLCCSDVNGGQRL